MKKTLLILSIALLSCGKETPTPEPVIEYMDVEYYCKWNSATDFTFKYNKGLGQSIDTVYNKVSYSIKTKLEKSDAPSYVNVWVSVCALNQSQTNAVKVYTIINSDTTDVCNLGGNCCGIQ